MASLKAAANKIQLIHQAIVNRGWAKKSNQWLIAASKVLEPDMRWASSESFPISIGSWLRFCKGEPVRPDTFRAFCTILELDWQEIAFSPSTTTNPKHDWGEIPDTTIFIHRNPETTTLQQWLTSDRARLISIIGSGGIGKTALAAHIAQANTSEFPYIIWRSLREAPTVEKILSDCITLLSDHHHIALPTTLNDQITILIDRLRTTRCLIILDNAESILQSGTLSGNYQHLYQGYSHLFHRIGTTIHQSCLIVTSREQLQEPRQLQGEFSPVKTLQLTGLTEASKILHNKGITGTLAEIAQLTTRYHGNPLALQLVASTIQKTFHNNITNFLASPSIFGDIETLLTSQFDRLSAPEKSIMYWLAIYREPVIPHTISTDILNTPLKTIITVIDSLLDRSFIQVTDQGFTLQNVVMEYVTDRFIHYISQELASQQFDLLCTHAIMQATTKEYIRETQKRLLLAPVINHLGHQQQPHIIAQKLRGIIYYFRHTQNYQISASNFHIGYAIGNLINLLLALSIDLTSYDFSTLPIRQAYLQGATLHQVNFAYCHFAQTVFSQDLGSIFSVTFSPDQQLLATGGMDGYIRLWQIADGQQIAAWLAHSDWIRNVTFSPDGQQLASTSNDHTIKIWNWQQMECQHVLHGHTDWVWSARFISWQGLQFLVSVSSDHTAKVWNLNLGKCLFTFHEPEDLIWSVAFSNNGRTIASSSAKSIKLWNIWTKQCTKIVTDRAERIQALAFSPNGQTLVGSDEHQIKVWDVSSGHCLTTIETPPHTAIWLLTFSPDGSELISAGTDKIQIWNATNWHPLTTLAEPHHRVRSIAYSPLHNMMAMGSDDQLIRLWDTHTRQPLRTLYSFTNRIWTIALSPILANGLIYLASGSDDGHIRLWHAQTGELLHTYTGHQGRIRSLAFSPNGQYLASASHDRTIKLWNVVTGHCLQTYRSHTDWVWSAIFSVDELTLISAADDRTILLWDINTNKPQRLFTNLTEWIWAIATHPQHPLVAIAGNNQTIELWDLPTQTLQSTLIGHQQRVRSIIFNTMGSRLASCSDDGVIKLWDLQHHSCLKTFTGHTQEIRTLTFIPPTATTPEYLVSASDDLTIRVWDTDSGACLGILKGHSQSIWSICYSDDLQTLFSCSLDTTIKFWNLTTFHCTKTLTLPKPYQNTNITNVTGLSIATQSTLIALGALAN